MGIPSCSFAGFLRRRNGGSAPALWRRWRSSSVLFASIHSVVAIDDATMQRSGVAGDGCRVAVGILLEQRSDGWVIPAFIVVIDTNHRGSFDIDRFDDDGNVIADR